MLATRWSVLVSPSLNDQKQRLRISSDDAKEISKDITSELMQARDSKDWGTIEQIENEFLLIVSRAMTALLSLWFGFVWEKATGNLMSAGTTVSSILIKPFTPNSFVISHFYPNGSHYVFLFKC